MDSFQKTLPTGVQESCTFRIEQFKYRPQKSEKRKLRKWAWDVWFGIACQTLKKKCFSFGLQTPFMIFKYT